MFDLTSGQWTVAGVVGLISYFIFYVRRRLTYWERQGIDGPKPFFLFSDIISKTKRPTLEKISINYKKYGKVFGSYSGLQSELFVADPEILRSICIKDFSSWPQGFTNSGYLHPVERHLLNLYGDQWKRMRTLLSPTFSSGKIKKMFQLIKACNLDAQKVLATMTADGQIDFDPKYFWGRYNLDVIAKCCFAANLDVYGDKEDSLLKRFVRLFKPNRMKVIVVILLPKWLIKLLRFTPSDVENLEYLRDLTYALITKRKETGDRAEDFLQLLIDRGEHGTETNGSSNHNKEAILSREEIVASSIVFLLAGYETTSTLLTWACYRLAANPNVQQKLFDEVSKVDIHDYEVLSSLPYLDAVINETLRIDPPIIFFQRTNNYSDYVLPGTNALIRKGTLCTIPIHAIHHDPDNYSDPEVYDPERFIREPPKPFTFVPFGAGPRTCIGMRFALINTKLSLASLVRDYHLITTNKTPKKFDFVKSTAVLTAKSLTLAIKPRQFN